MDSLLNLLNGSVLGDPIPSLDGKYFVIPLISHGNNYKGKYVFPSIRSPERHISEGTVNSALRRLGIAKEEHCAHGFRSTMDTMLNNSGLWNKDAIERQLSHKDKDSVRGVYNRAEYWSERCKMMCYWADLCDAMKCGGEIVPFKKTGS